MEDYLKVNAPRIEPIEYTHVDINGQEQTVKTTMLMLPAVVKSIPEHVNTNAKSTKWRLITVTILNPVTQKLEDTSAQLFEKSLAKFNDSFAVDGEIEIAVQTEGKYAGYAKAQLKSASRINVSSIMEFLTAKEEASTAQVAETA